MSRTESRRERGSVLAVALVLTFLVAGLGTAMLLVADARRKDEQSRIHSVQRRCLAECGLSEAVMEIATEGDGVIANSAAPVRSGPGEYWTTCTSPGPNRFTITSYGRVGSDVRTMRAEVRENVPTLFHHALYAGNGGHDPSYTLALGGTGTKADQVDGDVYSGGNLTVSGNAAVTGTVQAAGTITGIAGDRVAEIAPPNLAARHYETNNDVNVSAEFRTSGTNTYSSSYGGTAVQLPEANPAHIFRKNPSDRADEIRGTTKDDYFLEDPYQTVNTSSSVNSNNATPITLSGLGGAPGVSGTKKLYYIDGNLWVHNLNIYNFVIKHNEADGVQVTFVVKGNIYLSDNILLRNPVKDGIALIALKDTAVADSGNIYFGDPEFGTLEQMDAYMYAENDFKDNNLSTSGSAVVRLNGVMSAGNKIQVNRGSGTTRTQLVVDFDPRVRDGSLVLPGLPDAAQTSPSARFTILAMFEVGSR